MKKEIKILKTEKEIPCPIRNQHNNVMVGVLHEPRRKADTIVIAVHGFMSSKDSLKIKHVCIALARHGVAAYRFDLSGNGDSEGRFEDATPEKMLQDLDAVIEHFRPRYKKIILYGRSMGGWLSILTAAVRKVDGVITCAAPMHWDERFEKNLAQEQREQLASVEFTTIPHHTPYGDFPLTLREQFITEVRSLHPLDLAKKITCPVLVIHGSKDELVPIADSEDLIKALKKKELFLIGGAGHRMSKPEHLDAMTGKIVSWVKQFR
jgi:pimeloyl-ACP methyl ester carboxylesterase